MLQYPIFNRQSLHILLSRTDALYYDTLFFFLMIRRPPRSTLDRSSAASDVYKRQVTMFAQSAGNTGLSFLKYGFGARNIAMGDAGTAPVSYTHLRAHETVLDLVCRLLLEKKKS